MPSDSSAPLLLALAGSERLGRAVAHAAGVDFGTTEERDFERGEHKSRPLVSVRNRDVAVLHCVHGDLAGTSVNDRLVRLWFFTATLADAGAQSVTVVVPYLPYSRKDRRTKTRDPVNSRYVAQHFEASGADRIVAIEPHNQAAFENAFRIEALALPVAPLVADWVAANRPRVPLAVVSPDVGGTKRAQRLRELLARRLGAEVGLAFVEKRRSAGLLSSGLLVGEVAGAQCLVIDDLVSSGSTLAHSATACRAAGAHGLWVAAAHGLFQPAAGAILRDAGFDKVLVTDSVPVAGDIAARLPIETLPLGPYVGGVLRRVWFGGSIGELTGMDA